jgi:UDP-N-acetylmuramoyl-L-alanyl-D-glutamate--2,6-diaminopimelate ligase
MKLGELLKDCDYIKTFLERLMDLDISGVAYDSRRVKDGYLFVAVAGERFDGHDFIEDAVNKGAVAIVGEKEFMGKEDRYISVKSSRKALACIANNFYEKPSESLTLIGVTGTNGKTTTTYILKSILESWGKGVGLIGTIQYIIKDKTCTALHTTPESLEFQSFLKDMLLSGCTHVISEVSSHSLAQFRVDNVFFDTALFTNLTRDHLDFHKTMEDYFRAKERLFIELLDNNGTAVINLDDPYGKRLFSSITSRQPSKGILTYGLEPGADIIAGDIDNSFQGLSFTISFRGRSYKVSSYLIGFPNVYNIMSAVGVSISIGVPWQIILEGISETGNIKGRFEKVDMGQSFLCIIDYAHTEDALERLIYTARELVTKNSLFRTQHHSPRVITVFGCGGDRDHGKRPGMGAIATRLSDFVFITSDNPRTEEPLSIIKEIEVGAVSKNYVKEPDRREAIRKAVNMADDCDIVLIAGKGHEDYQEIKGIRYSFNDRDVTEEIIKDRLKIQNVK